MNVGILNIAFRGLLCGLFFCLFLKHKFTNSQHDVELFVQVYRNKKWIKVMSDTLIPGDIVSISKCLFGPCQ